ncbi:MAG TPA: citrate (Si)-synthase [Anaerolineales bacterium]|nr:citrate (Si)-synthase [Anaerolineales bacterium]
MLLKEKIAAQLPAWQTRVKRLVKEFGEAKVGEVTIDQVYGGMRGVKGLVSDISSVDPNEGIRLRGFTIPELIVKLPKPPGAEMPYVGGLYHLLLTGEVPTLEEARAVEAEWNARSQVPGYVFDALNAMPEGTKAMTLFSLAILAMQKESVFTRAYETGMRKDEYWQYTLEDSLNLTAKLPAIAAYIYYKLQGKDVRASAQPDLDWAGNFGKLLGVSDPDFADLARLYFIIHSDHESGNVSAHATHLVGTTLSDVYYAASAGMNGLAGPLHGRANQDALHWLKQVRDQYGRVPSRQELETFSWEKLNAGQVIPGYGHAILRITDPRYTALYDFGRKHFQQDDLFDLAVLVYDVVPDVLRRQGKAKDPWPNVDAISGTLLNHYGVEDCGTVCGFYTVVFGVSRILGVSANLVWARALGQPLERPKSLTTADLEAIAAKAAVK